MRASVALPISPTVVEDAAAAAVGRVAAQSAVGDGQRRAAADLTGVVDAAAADASMSCRSEVLLVKVSVALVS